MRVNIYHFLDGFLFLPLFLSFFFLSFIIVAARMKSKRENTKTIAILFRLEGFGWS